MKKPAKLDFYLLISTLVIAIAMMTGGCIHTYPSPDGGEDPTEIMMELRIEFDAEWEKFGVNANLGELLRSPAEGMESWPVKLVVMATSKNGETITETSVFEPEEISEGTVTIPMSSVFHATSYRIIVWACYLDPSTYTPLGYDLEKLPVIRETVKHGTESARRLALYGVAEIDLRNLAGTWHSTQETAISLTPPLARFRLVADDYADFLAYTEEDRKKGETYTVTLNYDSEIPVGFNLSDGQAIDPMENCNFTLPLPVITVPGVEMAVASDWILNPPQRIYHTVSLTVFDSAKAVVAHIDGVTFPVEAGNITTVRGNLLTNFITGGIKIDNIWGGEIIIELE